ncbi:hypothetical protein GNF76_18145 [Pseudomonas sp. CCM 7893]|uniref:Uncharacterized protein n=1 Tax=Pseudomonas spelaei TaxID=1055469 RepID=A0A6I3WII2_9PSED|nr:hypothetical protein [Pseudomonas spelaei]MUF06276.1 hypothetical protein [Pseudomonas spelaei]
MSTGKTIIGKEQAEKYHATGTSDISIFVNGRTHSFVATRFSASRAFVEMESHDESIFIDYGGDLGPGEHELTAKDLHVIYRDPPGHTFNRVTDGTLKVVVVGNTFKATLQNLRLLELDGETTARLSGTYTINL